MAAEAVRQTAKTEHPVCIMAPASNPPATIPISSALCCRAKNVLALLLADAPAAAISAALAPKYPIPKKNAPAKTVGGVRPRAMSSNPKLLRAMAPAVERFAPSRSVVQPARGLAMIPPALMKTNSRPSLSVASASCASVYPKFMTTLYPRASAKGSAMRSARFRREMWRLSTRRGAFGKRRLRANGAKGGMRTAVVPGERAGLVAVAGRCAPFSSCPCCSFEFSRSRGSTRAMAAPQAPTRESTTKSTLYPQQLARGNMIAGPAISEAVVANRTTPTRLPRLEAGGTEARYCATLGWNRANPNACIRRRMTTCHKSVQCARARQGTAYPSAPAIMAKRLPRLLTVRSSAIRSATAANTNRLFCRPATSGPAPSVMT